MVPLTDRVCLAGATGYLGTRVAAAFRLRGTPVTAIVRSAADSRAVRYLQVIGADIVAVDASLRESYAAALNGVGTAISCMASRNVHVDAGSDFWAIDRDANIRFGLTAIAAHARHIILVATFEGRSSRRDTAFSDAKEQAVDALRAASGSAGIPFTVIRPTAYFSDLTDRAFASVAARDRCTVIGSGSHRINPVDGGDVAAFIVAHALQPASIHEDLPVGGPDVFEFREIGELAAVVLGTRPGLSVRHIPVTALRLMALMAAIGGFGSPTLRRLTALVRWMVYAATHDAIAPSCGERRLRDNFAAKAEAAVPDPPSP